MITLNQIQKRLAEEIKRSGITQKEIANKIGVCQQAVSSYVNGKKLPALDTLANLCKLLDLDANYIIGVRISN